MNRPQQREPSYQRETSYRRETSYQRDQSDQSNQSDQGNQHGRQASRSAHRTLISRGVLLLIVLLLSSQPLACRAPATSAPSQSSASQPSAVIGLAMDTLVIERWESDRNIFVATVNSLKGQVIVQNANSDATEQENQIRYLIEKAVDVLVIVAIDEVRLRDEVSLAREKGIRVIAYDRMIHQSAIDLYISFDNTAVGQLMATTMTRLYPQGRFIIMNGASTDNNSRLLRQGIQAVLDAHPDCQVIAETSAVNWSADDAFTKFRALLAGQSDVDGIFCSNDALAGAAVRALALYKKAGKVAVTGQDADLDACQRIVEGTQLMTVYKPIDRMARAAAEAAIALAHGQTPLASDTITIDSQEIPYYRISPEAVTRDNMIEVIVNSGFHDLKDIYRNVPREQWPTQFATR